MSFRDLECIADDIQLHLSFTSSAEDVVRVLEHCLTSIIDWTRANKLKLNPDKTEMLLEKSSDRLRENLPGIDGVTIP